MILGGELTVVTKQSLMIYSKACDVRTYETRATSTDRTTVHVSPKSLHKIDHCDLVNSSVHGDQSVLHAVKYSLMEGLIIIAKQAKL